MRRDDVSTVTASQAKLLASWSVHWLALDPKDSLDGVLEELSHLSHPMVFLLLPASGQAFDQEDHFAALRQARIPLLIRFVIPAGRAPSADLAERYGFAHSSTLEEALAAVESYHRPQFGQTPLPDAAIVQSLLLPSSKPRLSVFRASVPPFCRRQRLRAISVLTGLVLLSLSVPVLLYLGVQAPRSALVSPEVIGTVAFGSSGQLDPTSGTGVNDLVTVTLARLAAPALGMSVYCWLLPDTGEPSVHPLLLGTLLVVGGEAHLTYAQPQHDDLLAQYSGVRITEQPVSPLPTAPSTDPRTWRAYGAIPTIPTPGDEQQYSLLSHVRHLLASDPTVSALGLAGGLSTWLLRNSGKLVEWTGAARDSWAGSQTSIGATQLMHRQGIRILDYLDGQAFIARDVPASTPWLVDLPQGRIGLLAVDPNENPPAYLTHVGIHLMGVAYAPGHTQAQQRLAMQMHAALATITMRMQRLHQDAKQLLGRNDAQLRQSDALTLLNDMTSQATTAFSGQFDPSVGGNTGGVTWMAAQMEQLAVIALKRNGSAGV